MAQANGLKNPFCVDLKAAAPFCAKCIFKEFNLGKNHTAMQVKVSRRCDKIENTNIQEFVNSIYRVVLQTHLAEMF